MDAIGYLVNRNFVLVALEASQRLNFKGQEIVIPRAKKAYKLSDTALVTVFGNPYKATYIKKYITTLARLGTQCTFDSIVDDLHDVFNTAQNQMSASVEKITKLLTRFQRDDGRVDTVEVERYLSSDEEIQLLRDITSSELNNHSSFTIVNVIGYDVANGVRVATLIIVGSKVEEVVKDNLPTNSGFIQIINPDTALDQGTQQRLAMKVAEHMPLGWQANAEQVNLLLDNSKSILTEGLHKVSDFVNPEIVFYELSARTGYSFTEPNIHLSAIEYNYSKDNTQGG